MKGTYKEYFKLHIFHSIISLLICLLTAMISIKINYDNQWINLLLNGILCLTLPNILYFVVAIKMPEFKIYKERMINLIRHYKEKK